MLVYTFVYKVKNRRERIFQSKTSETLEYIEQVACCRIRSNSINSKEGDRHFCHLSHSYVHKISRSCLLFAILFLIKMEKSSDKQQELVMIIYCNISYRFWDILKYSCVAWTSLLEQALKVRSSLTSCTAVLNGKTHR